MSERCPNCVRFQSDGDGIEVAGQLLQCEARLEMGEVVASVEGPSQIALLAPGEDEILIVRGTGFSTRRGKHLPGDLRLAGSRGRVGLR